MRRIRVTAALAVLLLGLALPGAARAALFDITIRWQGFVPETFSGRIGTTDGVVTTLGLIDPRRNTTFGLLAPGGFDGNDNAFAPPGPWVGTGGLAFSTPRDLSQVLFVNLARDAAGTGWVLCGPSSW